MPGTGTSCSAHTTGAVLTVRRRLSIRGRVQGVGFRPFVYRIATALNLTGHVANNAQGAVIEVQGSPETIDRFLEQLHADLPTLAQISQVTATGLTAIPEREFRIESSSAGRDQDAEITPDAAVCEDCLREMLDPGDRRYRYPFINCTNCGPRYSIIQAVPYDRPNTTMSDFRMCPECQAEYDDPSDRRFHAQPNACAVCGPRLWFASSDGTVIEGDPIRLCAERLQAGEIVAVKGIGGFHLVCRADDDAAVERLRTRKGREAKPFAMMAPDFATCDALVELDGPSVAALQGIERPIVLAPKRRGAPISPHVAPGSDCFGIMLPYAPLHHLLFAEGRPLRPPRGAAATAHEMGRPPRGAAATGSLGRRGGRPVRSPAATAHAWEETAQVTDATEGLGPLVMTSGNPSEEPLCCDNDEALRRLSSIADAFLLHDRRIQRGVDDSVVMAIERPSPHVLPIRRARGFAPAPVPLAVAAPEPILAVGGEMKSAICILNGSQAVLSEHLGDLGNAEAFRNFVRTVEQFTDLLRVDPRVIACDMHPDYPATRHARRMGLDTISVQHHHAHVVSCMADNCISGHVIGVSCDGTGYGPDNAIWGCEILTCDEAAFTRAAHLRYFPLLGGDAAARETWRPAAGLLAETFGSEWQTRVPDAFADVSEAALRLAASRLLPNSPVTRTSSLGRLFDAAAFLLGICGRNRYEAEAAMALEAAAGGYRGDSEPLPYTVSEQQVGGAALELDFRPLISALVNGLQAGRSAPELARAFHNAVASMLAAGVQRVAAETGLTRVVLSGGCLANRLLLDLLHAELSAQGLTVYSHRRVPPGDGGLALGQAVVAAEILRRQSVCA